MDSSNDRTVTDTDWLRRWALASRQVTLEVIPENRSTCILTTRVSLAVLDRFGVQAKPRPVAVVAETASAQRLREDGVPPSQWPSDAWSVGVHPGQPHAGSGWNGHLVLVVRTTEHMRAGSASTVRFLVDLTADQFARPQHGIPIDGPLIFGMSGGSLWTPHDPVSISLGDGAASIAYWPMSPGLPEAKAWRDAPDWTVDTAWVDEIADEIVQRVEASR